MHINELGDMFISINNLSFTSIFLKAACSANSGAERIFLESKFQLFKHISLKFLKLSGKSNASLLRYKS